MHGAIEPLHIILGISVVTILSFFFNMLSNRLNIPSVILLIVSGVLIQFGVGELGFDIKEINTELFVLLEIFGLVGLVMIVLEAALDLKLNRENKWILIKSLLVALFILLVTSFSIAAVFYYLLNIENFTMALIHAIPLSIMSSAIIIPSVANLEQEKKEFMIYESTFSDILGIMMFYMLIDSSHMHSTSEIIRTLSLETILTIVISIVLSYLMVALFQNVKGHGKLVLMISILFMIYALGKIFHLSSLLLILIFGIVLNNKEVFFRGALGKVVKQDTLSHILLEEFKVVIIEGSFFIRTVFFILFGMSIDLSTLTDPLVLMITGIILVVLYVLRFLNLKVFIRSSIFPELFIAPRGLITILLFFAIPLELQSTKFNSGILLLTILSTSLIMMLALIANKQPEEIMIIDEAAIDEIDVVHDLLENKSEEEIKEHIIEDYKIDQNETNQGMINDESDGSIDNNEYS